MSTLAESAQGAASALDCGNPPPPCVAAPWEAAAEGRGERRDAAENRRRVLAAARDLFAARGVDQVAMQEIARVAGIGQGTLYRRYAHKGELCMALLDDNLRATHAAVAARLADESEPALAQLDFFLTTCVDFLEGNAHLLGAVADAACGDRRHDAHDNPLAAWQRGTVETLLTRAVARGEIPALDIPAAAAIVLAPFGIDHYLHQRHARGHTPERILASIRRVLFAGLRGQPAPAGG